MLRWIVDKEVFAIVSTCRQLKYLMFGRLVVYCDHRNPECIFLPNVTGLMPLKIAARQPQGWGSYLGQFEYIALHIQGADNLWGGLLSR